MATLQEIETHWGIDDLYDAADVIQASKGISALVADASRPKHKGRK